MQEQLKQDGEGHQMRSAVVPLELEPGHYKTLIDEMGEYLVDKTADLIIETKSKNFDEAFKLSIIICETQDWIDMFKTWMKQAAKISA